MKYGKLLFCVLIVALIQPGYEAAGASAAERGSIDGAGFSAGAAGACASARESGNGDGAAPEAAGAYASARERENGDGAALEAEAAEAFARIALRCIQKEYPNKLSHVLADSADVASPMALHPAFYGCFDWHSCVHGHWMLVRLLRLFPDDIGSEKIMSMIEENITGENIEREAEYMEKPGRKSFERTYGWAWLLKLAQELHEFDSEWAVGLSGNLSPLTELVARSYMEFLPKQTYPIRRGVHANTAFGLSFALDYARAVGNSELEELIVERAVDYYGEDRGCPGSWEPGGDDFLSPCLIEADLMRRVLGDEDFRNWFHIFLPGLKDGEPAALLKPATVTDRSDPKIVHLDGLNLSRAWCLYGIAGALDEDDPVKGIVLKAADAHAEDALAHVASGNYEGEHWLASFAVYMLSVKDSME